MLRSLISVFCLACCVFAEVRGRVEDPEGRPVAGAVVTAYTPAGNPSGSATTGEDGAFLLPQAAAGHQVTVVKDGFQRLERKASNEETLRLRTAGIRSAVTVTALPGSVENMHDAPQLLSALERSGNLALPMPTLGQILQESAGILVQQTAPGQVSPFLRGMTGYHVLNLLDGVRYNNSTFRSGPNQYLAWVEPSQAERVEAMLGPSGTQYGSDGLGGTIQVLSTPARFADSGRWLTHGEWLVSGDTADLGGGTSGEIGAGNDRLWLLFGSNLYRHNDLLTGGGSDSRNALRRYFNLEDDLIHSIAGTRLQDTAWSRTGVHAKFSYRLTDRHLLSGLYQHGALLGTRGYKDLWGGLGRVQSDFTPQTLDFLYARWEGLQLAGFDTMSARFSLNRQADGGARRNLRYTDPLTEEENTVRALGGGWQAATHFGAHSILTLNGELYDESVDSVRTVNSAASRPLYPDGSRYRTLGLAAQGATEFAGRRLRAGYGVRFSHIHFSNPADAQFTIPESSQSFTDWTWNASLQWRPSQTWGLHAAAGRGFRAPNLNDLGALGLNDLGYEIPISEAISANPLLSTSAGENALSKGVPAQTLGVEALINVEAGWRLTLRKVEARVQVFNAQLDAPIVRRTLLFSASGIPASLAGIPVTPVAPTAAQAAQGMVTVATPFDPRAVKAFVNDGSAVYRGIESDMRIRFTTHWSARAAYSFIGGQEEDPNRNHRRLPPQMGNLVLRYDAPGRHWWVEAAADAAGQQNRLSGGDLDDERIGASRSRNDIAAFFAGSRIAPYVDASGIFVPTGETLAQIQNRVLPGVGSSSLRVPLYTSTAGWVSFGLRAGCPIGERWSLSGSVNNLLDKNYRIHGSGIDGPGRSAYLALGYRW